MGANLTLCSKKNFFTVIKGFRVEPVVFLNFMALGIFQLVSQIGTYQVICYHALGSDPRFDCAHAALGGHSHGAGAANRINETASGHDRSPTNEGNWSRSTNTRELEYAALETELQQAAVKWQMIFQLCHALPAIFTDTLLGAFGDRHGRQVNIMIGILGSIITMYAMIVMFTFKRAPLFILIISNLVSGFTGYMSIIMISSFAYLADTIVDHEMLTVRMTYVSVIISVSGIISPQIGGFLMRALTNAQVTLTAEATLVVAFLLTLLIVRQYPPALMRKKMLEKYIKENGHPPPAGNEKFEKFHTKSEPKKNGKDEKDEEKNEKGGNAETGKKGKDCAAECAGIWKSFLRLWKEVYETYSKARPGHARLYLLFASFVYFLHVTFEGGIRMSVFSLYVLKSPFSWGPAELSTYRSVNSALHLAGSVIGVALFKNLLKLSDTTIILLAMGTHIVESVLFAVAYSTAGLYVAATAGSFVPLMTPCVKSFISQLVNPDEVGKSFAAFGIATTIAHIASNVIYSNIYSATVGWYDGFAFLVAGGLELFCMTLFLWLHVDYHYDGSLKKWAKVYTGACARLIRRKPVAEVSPAPTAVYSTKEQALDIVKEEAAADIS